MLGVCLLGCGGGAPLMHSAHVLAPEQMEVGAGFSSEFRLAPTKTEADPLSERMLDQIAFAPGLAPWVSARLGFEDQFEAGLAYTGRTVRLDLRHAFTLGEPTALSLGLGASGVLPGAEGSICPCCSAGAAAQTSWPCGWVRAEASRCSTASTSSTPIRPWMQRYRSPKT
jgi:hypothetical protein